MLYTANEAVVRGRMKFRAPTADMTIACDAAVATAGALAKIQPPTLGATHSGLERPMAWGELCSTRVAGPGEAC